jgi:hypothetical protein
MKIILELEGGEDRFRVLKGTHDESSGTIIYRSIQCGYPFAASLIMINGAAAFQSRPSSDFNCLILILNQTVGQTHLMSDSCHCEQNRDVLPDFAWQSSSLPPIVWEIASTHCGKTFRTGSRNDSWPIMLKNLLLV